MSVGNSLKQLLATIDKHSSNYDSTPWSDCSSPENRKFSPVRLMLSFDECRDLFDTCTFAPETPDPGNEQRSAFQILCSAFGVCTSQDLFVVYLSTDLGLVPYSPGHLDPENLQAPIVELPFDIFATVEEDNVKLEQVSEPGYMVQFGRPLSVNAVSFMTYLLMQLQGFGRNGRRRLLLGLTMYSVICFFLRRRKSWACSISMLLSMRVMANSLLLELG